MLVAAAITTETFHRHAATDVDKDHQFIITLNTCLLIY